MHAGPLFPAGPNFILDIIEDDDKHINKSLYVYLFTVMKTATNIFKALSDETRLRVIKLLEERELCVCELMQVLDMSQPRISRHLGVLKNAGLVNDRREGKWVYYSLSNGAQNQDLETILGSIPSLGNDNPVVLQDRENLKQSVRLSEAEGPCAACGTDSTTPIA